MINIGDKAEIQCNYTVFPFYNPTFIINGVSTDLKENEDGLGEYAHNSSSIFCPYAQFSTCTVYTLTLSSVSRDYNGTTYQCHPYRHTSRKSENVTLIVRGGHNIQAHTHIHTHTHTHTHTHLTALS